MEALRMKGFGGKSLVVRAIFSLLLVLVASISPWSEVAVAADSNLFISEYVEGGSYNKAIELYNPTGAAIDLAGKSYVLEMYFNGSTSAGKTIALQGTIAAGDVFVVAEPQAGPEILNVADQTESSGWFNGDDAIVLKKGDEVVDSIGQVGTDPGSQWGSGDTSTKDNTLRRLSTVCAGDTNPDDSFAPAAEWEGYPKDTFDGLGAHTAECGGSPSCTTTNTIAEVQGTGNDSPLAGQEVTVQGIVTAVFGNQFVMQDGTGPRSGVMVYAPGHTTSRGDDVCLTGTVTEYYDMTEIKDTTAIEVQSSGNSLPAAEVLTADAINTGSPTAEDWESVLVQVQAVSITNEDLGYGEFEISDVTGAVRVDDNGSWSYSPANGDEFESVTGVLYYTYSNFKLEPRDDDDFVGLGTPQPTCGDTATLIHDIQGSGLASPKVGETHTIEGVVVGDFQGSDELKGFFVQEEDSDADSDTATSEGIFVYAPGAMDVATGDVVRMTGEVAEYHELTEMTGVSSLEICSSGASVAATDVSLPVAAVEDLEAYEGMLVTFAQELTVSENYNLGRYGELVLSNGRLWQPTHVEAPGTDANAYAQANKRNRIMLDDGSTQQNPDPVIHPAPELSFANTLRGGDTVTGLTGVINYSYDEYRVQPTETPSFTHSNPRTATPQNVGGTLKIASFNVLNYFNTIDNGNPICGPDTSQDCRGADSDEEFTRQRDKIIRAINAMDAEVVGLMEIENNASASLQDLVNGLNDLAGAGTYDFINSGTIGDDAIKVGLIYKPASVMPVGSFAVLDDSVDPTYTDEKNRPALAQTFERLDGGNATGERVTVIVNHFKSKGSPCDSLGDPDMGDGQGNCNLTRTKAANALVNWLANDPTGSGDSDFLIIGDLNAYAQEDPITAIKNAGYTNLIEQYMGDAAYSYVFFGEAGYLDHALSSASLTPQVTGVTEWHINTDEPKVLDYNVEYKSADQVEDYYAQEPYRASDHDPVIVGLDLQPSTGSITIIHEANPTAPWRSDFHFSSGLGDFNLDASNDGVGNVKTFNDVALNTAYTFTEDGKPGWWDITDITCSPEGSDTVVDLDAASATVTLTEAGEEVTCTFRTERRGQIKISKYEDVNSNGIRDEGEPSLSSWDMSVYRQMDDGGYEQIQRTKPTNDKGIVYFTGLVPDTYRVCETQQDGWVNTAPGDVCQELAVGYGDNTPVEFGNYKLATITIVEDATPQTYKRFRFKSDLDTFFRLWDSRRRANPSQTFTDIAPGSYHWFRQRGTGRWWGLEDITCSQDEGVNIDVANRKVTIGPLASGSEVTCTFENSRSRGR